MIIGNKDYRTPDVPDVSFAHRDADAIKRYVTGTLGFRARNIIDLRDATLAEIERAFGNEPGNVSPDRSLARISGGIVRLTGLALAIGSGQESHAAS